MLFNIADRHLGIAFLEEFVENFPLDPSDVFINNKFCTIALAYYQAYMLDS